MNAKLQVRLALLTFSLIACTQEVKEKQITELKYAEQVWLSINESNDNAFAYIENKPNLPNVLIYGDSISIAYTSTVRSLLEDRANVYRIFGNGGSSSMFIPKMKRMEKLMKNKRLKNPWNFQWDIIHFNVGLHDLLHLNKGKKDKVNGKVISPLNKYEENLKKILKYIKTYAPKAKIIFATTTPVPDNSWGRISGDAEKYNKIALKVIKEDDTIIVNNLYDLTKLNHKIWMIDLGDVHFNKIGSTAQGKAVAKVIGEQLKIHFHL